MCTTQQDGKHYDENGKRLFTAEDVLKAAGALGHTSGKPEELAEKASIISAATAAHYGPDRTAS